VQLWEHVTAWLDYPHLYELQRPKTPKDIDHIVDAFKPYLEARDWLTVSRKAP
jgi:hypothetical protein